MFELLRAKNGQKNAHISKTTNLFSAYYEQNGFVCTINFNRIPSLIRVGQIVSISCKNIVVRIGVKYYSSQTL